MGFEAFFEMSQDLCCIAGTDGFLKLVNDAFVEKIGYSREELLAVPFELFIHPDDRIRTGDEVKRINDDRDPASITVEGFQNRWNTASGDLVWLQWRSVRNNNVIYAVARDITSFQKREAMLKQALEVNKVLNEKFRLLACVDELTQLGNRREAERIMASEFSRCRRQKSTLTVALLDIDHFKKVNDTYGHEAGDIVLRHSARAIRETLRTHDHAFRYGGEEFLIVLPDVAIPGAVVACQRIQKALGELRLGLGPIRVSCGVADAIESPKDAVRLADQRLYKAKETRNAIVSEGTGVVATPTIPPPMAPTSTPEEPLPPLPTTPVGPRTGERS